MSSINKMSNYNYHSSPFHSCFNEGSTTANQHSPTAAQPQLSSNPNLTTSLYHTEFGLFALTWSRSLFSRSLHLHVLLNNRNTNLSLSSLSTTSFKLHIKPFIFWSKYGSKKLNEIKNGYIYWDLSKAKFGSGPEPLSGFYISIVVNGEIVLLVGDSPKQAEADSKRGQVMVVKREHVYGNKIYTTKADFNGVKKEITIDCRVKEQYSDDPRLYISVDNKSVLKIKHLKWKFRGNEKIEVDGVTVQVSWDVYNWLFEDDDQEAGYAQFMFRFEKKEAQNEMILWSQQSFGFDYETMKMKKGLCKMSSRTSSSTSSSISSSISSTSSNNSVLEWASVEENELKGPSGFSLIVYAWKN